MIIDLRGIFDAEGEVRNFERTIPPEDLDDIKNVRFSSPVTLNCRVKNNAGIVTLDYSADFSLLMRCDRCLKELDTSYHYDFSHIVVRNVNNDNDEYIVAGDENIDMKEIAVTDILLQLPTKFLCKEDCKGLCMVCGCDLNESECDCLK